MERERRTSVSTFHAPGAWETCVQLGGAAAHHALVKRLDVGDIVSLSSGDGRRARGAIASLSKGQLCVAVDEASEEHVPRPVRIELLPPVGDRDRMLLLAEKAVELGASSWQPVSYRRSRSVVPRGVGDAFREKVRLRQVGALEQCGSAWLPELLMECTLDAALSAERTSSTVRLLLDVNGEPLGDAVRELRGAVRIAIGPEGGLDEEERDAFLRNGWRTASLGANVLRFETAGIAALAVLRSHLR